MDCVLLYQVTFQTRGRHSQEVDAQGWGPPYAVLVRTGGEQLHPLYDKSCSLLRTVAHLLPSTAKGTRAASAACTAAPESP
jgi:hypothetical protein